MLALRTKLILILSLILISGFSAISVLSYTDWKKSVRTTIIEQNLPLSRDNIYSEIQRDMARPIFVSSLMAHDTFLKDWVVSGEKESEKIQKYLAEIRDKYGFASAFFVSDKTRKYYHYKGVLKRISFADPHDIWYYNFKAKNRDYVLDVDTNQAAKNHLTIFINHRLTGYNGDFLGAVGVGLDFDRVAVLIADYKKRFHRNVYMVDPNGLIQVHTDRSKIQSESIYDVQGIAGIAQRLLTRQDTPQLFEYVRSGRHFFITTRFIEELGWFLMVEQDETQALESTRRTLINNIVISLLITAMTLVLATLAINHFQKRLEGMAMRDPLTRAFNRNEFERRFKYMTDKNRRDEMNLCMILFDVDRFKSVNDHLGHLAGDRVIQSIARIALETVRSQDLLVRWGGDEFIILVSAGMDTARSVAERLRSSVAAYRFDDDLNIPPHRTKQNALKPVTISCGLTQYTPGQSLDALLKEADKALYRAKASGRNAICLAEG